MCTVTCDKIKQNKKTQLWFILDSLINSAAVARRIACWIIHFLFILASLSPYWCPLKSPANKLVTLKTFSHICFWGNPPWRNLLLLATGIQQIEGWFSSLLELYQGYRLRRLWVLEAINEFLKELSNLCLQNVTNQDRHFDTWDGLYLWDKTLISNLYIQ